MKLSRFPSHLFTDNLFLTLLFLKKNTSRNQERHLDTLHNFVTRATNELIWLNEKEEEEVAYDWSERNTNVDRKKGYHAVSELLTPVPEVDLELVASSDTLLNASSLGANERTRAEGGKHKSRPGDRRAAASRKPPSPVDYRGKKARGLG